MRGGRKGLRNAGLYGIRMAGLTYIFSANNISRPGSLSLRVTVTRVLFRVNGSKIPICFNSNTLVLLSVLSEAPYTALPSPTITVKANVPNSILDLRLNLLFLFLNREFFILPPCLWLISLSQLSTNNFKINEIYYFSICLVSNPSVTFLVTALFIRWKHRGWFSEWNGLKQLAAIRII